MRKFLPAAALLCAACSTVEPLVLADLDRGAYLTDPAAIDRLIGADRQCAMAQAALCAYQVEQHTTAPDGKMDGTFCPSLFGRTSWEGYGSPKPNGARTKPAVITHGPRAPAIRIEIPDTANRSRDAAFVARRGDEILIAFRGTLAAGGSDEGAFAADWANNTEFDLVADPELDGVEVHKGFRDSLANVFGDMTAHLKKLLEDRPAGQSTAIYLTGHSKGGAMAYIAALKLKRQNPALPIKGIYTFAAPRPGGESFSRQYDEALGSIPTWRYEHQADFIPHLVPEESEIAFLKDYLALLGLEKLPVGKYRSIGKLVFINGNAGLVVQLDPRERKLAELRAKAASLGGTWSAHKMRSYLEMACRREAGNEIRSPDDQRDPR